jgi:hypothetical protein
MAVVTRRRGVRVLMVVAAGFPLLLAGGAALLTVVIGGTCSGSGVGDAPSALAIRDIPASFVRIYEQVGAQFKIPWEVLAGIGQEECDQGRLAYPSCTPQPGATGPGVANFAGASGPMQIGVGGLAGNEYQSLRRYLPDPSLGPHDPTTAVDLAALVLIRDKGAPVRQPIDAYARYVRAYNGWGPRPMRMRLGCWPTRTPTRALGPRRSGLRAALRWARRLCRGEGEDPAEWRCGRAGRRAGRGAADDRGRQPNRPLRL